MSAADAGGNAAAQEQPRLVQHVILRKDLTKAPYKWPAGSMIAQGCHVVRRPQQAAASRVNLQEPQYALMLARILLCFLDVSMPYCTGV